MSGGKHSSDEEFEFDFGFVKYIFLIIVILALIAGVVFGAYSVVNKLKSAKTETVSSQEEVIEEKSKYDVLGKIKIDKINVEQDILDSIEDEALEQGVIKLYGDELNEPGNFCIAGHNYNNIFKRLDELDIGDEFEIIDTDKQSTKYKITEISSVDPTDLSMLRTEEGKTQITLITCENYSTKRLILKAEIAE